MIRALEYLLLIAGISAVTIGYVTSRFPTIFEDKARQAFWRVIGGYLYILGSVITLFAAYYLWS